VDIAEGNDKRATRRTQTAAGLKGAKALRLAALLFTL
jgi:hypothetical protein